jgi:hypothetical protein
LEARLNVTRTLRHAMKQLSELAPELAVHLEDSITTGASCCYMPRSDVSWAT